MWANSTYNFKFSNVSDGVTLKDWVISVLLCLPTTARAGLSSFGILSHSSMLRIMGWETIYIPDQNCQRRALIIEKVTESKEQNPPLLQSLLPTWTESHSVSSKHNYLNFKEILRSGSGGRPQHLRLLHQEAVTPSGMSGRASEEPRHKADTFRSDPDYLWLHNSTNKSYVAQRSGANSGCGMCCTGQMWFKCHRLALK